MDPLHVLAVGRERRERRERGFFALGGKGWELGDEIRDEMGKGKKRIEGVGVGVRDWDGYKVGSGDKRGRRRRGEVR